MNSLQSKGMLEIVDVCQATAITQDWPAALTRLFAFLRSRNDDLLLQVLHEG
jgi:hypothetical protein